MSNNLYIFAGQVAHTQAELARILGITLSGAKSIVYRFNHSMEQFDSPDVPWFYRIKIDAETTDADIEKIREETYSRYVRKCELYDKKVEFSPPQGKVAWEYTPAPAPRAPRGPVDGGGCQHRLLREENQQGKVRYYQTHENLDRAPQGVVYQNHDPKRVDREHRRRCYAENLWHPLRENIYYMINGVRFDTKTKAAKAAGVSYYKFCKKLDGHHELFFDLPDGWEERWD